VTGQGSFLKTYISNTTDDPAKDPGNKKIW